MIACADAAEARPDWVIQQLKLESRYAAMFKLSGKFAPEFVWQLGASFREIKRSIIDVVSLDALTNTIRLLALRWRFGFAGRRTAPTFFRHRKEIRRLIVTLYLRYVTF